MIDATARARQAVEAWLRLDADDPACNDARDVVAALGREALERAAGATSGSGSTRAFDRALAGAMADLREQLGELEVGDDDERSMFARFVAKVPGVGSPAERHARRLASARPRIESMVTSIESERAVLMRDNVTMRADLDRLHEIESELLTVIGDVQAYEDALEFAVDVEVPELDPRRTLFEDELLGGVRHRRSELERSRVTNHAGIETLESAMDANRAVIREIDTLSRTASNRLETR
ncbi:MAG: hypothetical protein AB8G26_15340 [Ilumatobacter sp.]